MADDTSPVEDHRFWLSDLCDDMLKEIFARLPVNKLLGVKRVSRTWKRCVDVVLTEVKVIVFDHIYINANPKNVDPTCSHLQLARDNRQTFFVNKFNDPWNYFELNDTNTAIIRSLIRFPNVNCLDLSCIGNVTNEKFKKLTDAFPQLECLSLGSVKLLDGQEGEVDWRRILGELSSKLVHLKICPDFFLNNEYLDLSFLLNGDRLRKVHLSYSEHLKPDLLDKLKNPSEIELSLDIDWLSLEYDFGRFNCLTFVVNKLTSTCRSLFKKIDAPTAFEISEKLGLEVSKFSSDFQLFLQESLIVFKNLKGLKMDSVKLDKNSFKCMFERLETLHLTNTSAKDDDDFAKLFGSMQQLKNLVIRINEWQSNYQHFPIQSLNILKRLEIIEIKVCIKKPEQIRMTELFDTLMLISSLKCVEIIYKFNRYLYVPQEIKQSLVVGIYLLCLSWSKRTVELQFNKREFKEDVNEEVMEWYATILQFEQISARYSEEEVYKVKITSKNVDY